MHMALAQTLHPVLLLLHLLALCAAAQTTPGATDAELLLSLKASFTNGDRILTDWTGVTAGPCGWPEIACSSNGQVITM
jgi:hypothetical protein